MDYKFKNNEDFLQNLKTNTELQNAFKEDPTATMQKVNIGELPNTKVYRMIVASLVVTVLAIVIGLIVIVLFDKANDNQTILTIFTAIASTAIGALAGVLMPAQRQS